MAKKVFKELKELSPENLGKSLVESQYTLFKAKMAHATKQLKNTALLWKLRKRIAMIKTIQAQSSKG